MKIRELLKQHKEGVSFEFFPPKSDSARASFLATLQGLKAYRPLYVSMTCGAGGSGAWEKTEEMVTLLLKEKGLVVMPHVTCANVTRQEIKALLERYKANGVENIMALRGDPPRGDPDFQFKTQELRYGEDLVTLVKEYRHFCIGVAVYPEGHLETSSLEEDLDYTKRKIDRGADFAVTQMFFDNRYYYAMRDRMEKGGITIPVLPGILPLTDLAKVKQFASICRSTIPAPIEEAMTGAAGNSEEMEKIGLEATIEQCRDLIRHGVKNIDFYTLNRLNAMIHVLDAIL